MSAFIALTIILGGLGIYLLLLSGWRRGGAALAVAALVFLIGVWARPMGTTGLALHFSILAVTTVLAAVMTITSRKPLYCALWFGLVLLSTAGLLLLIGAQFVAAVTVLIYAGAILVTLLFVLMLAQQAGLAPYDAQAREPFLATIVGTFTAGILMSSLVSAYRQEQLVATQAPPAVAASDSPSPVARLGATLFTDHLIGVEVMATLLLVALVGAVCIAEQRAARPEAPKQRPYL